MKIIKGDRIAITAKGRTVTGTVVSAQNHIARAGAPDCWYIEFTDTQRGDDFGYWKQDQDGGTVEVIAPKFAPTDDVKIALEVDGTVEECTASIHPTNEDEGVRVLSFATGDQSAWDTAVVVYAGQRDALVAYLESVGWDDASDLVDHYGLRVDDPTQLVTAPA